MSKFLVLAILIALTALFITQGWGEYFTLESLKAQQGALQAYYGAHPVTVIAAYLGIYIATTALSLPGATILTLAGGMLFGFGVGLVLVSIASTVGATCAFLVARFLFRDVIQRRFGDKLRAINAGVEREGAFYLFSLRLIPAFPFFIVNLVMGLTPIRTLTFFFVSQVGMLPGTAVYVNAGTQLGRIDSLRGILSPALLLSFVALGVLPIASKALIGFLKKRRFLGKERSHG